LSTVLAEPTAVTLEERLANGAELLFDMERQGTTGANYQRWLWAWLQLLHQYEVLNEEQAAA